MQHHLNSDSDAFETWSHASASTHAALDQDGMDPPMLRSLAESSGMCLDHLHPSNGVPHPTWFGKLKMRFRSTHKVLPFFAARFGSLKKKILPIKDILLLTTVTLAFSTLFSLFIYSVLIKRRVQVNKVLFDASTTNYMISVFSQFLVILYDQTLRALLAALRLAFAARNGGVSGTTFFGIDPGSQWLSVLRFALVEKLLNIWCDLRLWLPILALAMGSVLKFQASFAYYFVPGNIKMRIFAGLLPLDNRVLRLVPTADLTLYFSNWGSTLTTNSKYAVRWVMKGCGDGCRAILLPSGIEGTRQYGPFQNISIYGSGLLNKVKTLRVENATGIITKFESLENNIAFDPLTECISAGQMINDTLQICIRQIQHSIAVGWTACPQALFDTHSCSRDLAWTTGPTKWATLMTAYIQRTTTTYDRQNFSIVDVNPTSKPREMFLNATEYLEVFNKILIPTNTSTVPDINGINALIYGWTWMHRTYNEIFQHDKNSLMISLHNILAIPLQFTVTAVQFANYTAPKYPELELGTFPLPDDMTTNVISGSSNSMLVIQNWTGWLFIAVNVTLLLLVVAGILWILSQDEPIPTPTGMGDLDIVNLAYRMYCTKRRSKSSNTSNDANTLEQAKDRVSLTQFAHDIEMHESSSLVDFGKAKALREMTISLEQTSEAEMENMEPLYADCSPRVPQSQTKQ